MAADGSPQRIDLSGQWQVRLDGEGQFRPVQLPGSLRDSGLGHPVGKDTRWIGLIREEVWNHPDYRKYQEPEQFKVPFWLQPERHFVGSAHYRRTVIIPPSWDGRRVVLTLQRPHWRTEVSVDDTIVGRDDSLSTPHVYDLTTQLAPGEHTIGVRVDNSLEAIDVGLNSHSVSDHTQTAWHGIIGKIELSALPRATIEHADVFPAQNARSARVTLRVVNQTGAAQQGTIDLSIRQDGQLLGQQVLEVSLPEGQSSLEHDVAFDRQAKRWDEFHAELCQLEATLRCGKTAAAPLRVSFGVRHVATRGNQLLLNDRPLFLRGTLECCIFPLTGYPPTDVASWKRIVGVCKSHGLNHIRFHSWCPPEAAFVAADELGFYYQVECSSWPNSSTSVGNGEPIDGWLYREGRRVLDAFGNHPSFLLLAMGNEPGGPERGGKYLGPWVEEFKARTDRQLVTSGSGWPKIAANEFHVTPEPRIQQWGQGLASRINAEPPSTVFDYRDFVDAHDVPVISHEIGQWCVYPNLDEMPKYRGALKPRNFEIFRDLLATAGMLDQARDFLIASGKLQTLCYKEEIESALRTPGLGGFQLLDLHDFPGQGTALVGILDPFWDSKPYVSARQFRRFCGPTILLARLPKRIWTNDETLVADIEVSHFGASDLAGVTPRWTVSDGDRTIAAGQLQESSIPAGALTRLGRVQSPLNAVDNPQKLTLAVSLGREPASFENDWDFWVYPDGRDPDVGDDLLVTREFSEDVIETLNSGGKVVWLADPQTVESRVALGFSSIFWNTAWTGGQAPQTLGILCDPRHPALADFPTDAHSNWQWWELVSRARPMVLDSLPSKLRPVVQVVPDWFHPQRLGLVVEARVGEGKLLVCSIDLDSDLPDRPAARQMRRSLLRYAASDDFSPDVDLSVKAIQTLFRQPSTLQRLGATIQTSTFHSAYPATSAIDGKDQTIWHSDWGAASTRMPQWLVVDLGKICRVKGIRYVPRQDMPNGRIAEYEVLGSEDGTNWGRPLSSGTFAPGPTPQAVTFHQPQNVRFIKLVAHREVRGRAMAAVAEIDVLLADEPTR